jgi:hypothetical protein
VNQVGIILGPSLLGRSSIFNNILFSIKGQEILGMLSLMSYMLFNFVNTVKMDVGMIKRTGKKKKKKPFLPVLHAYCRLS